MGLWHIMRKPRVISDNNGFLVIFLALYALAEGSTRPVSDGLVVFYSFSSLECMAYASCRHRSSPLILIRIGMFFHILSSTLPLSTFVTGLFLVIFF